MTCFLLTLVVGFGLSLALILLVLRRLSTPPEALPDQTRQNFFWEMGREIARSVTPKVDRSHPCSSPWNCVAELRLIP